MNFRQKKKSEAANDCIILAGISQLTEFQVNKSAITYVSGELGV